MKVELKNQSIEIDLDKLTEEDKEKLSVAIKEIMFPQEGDKYFYVSDNGVCFEKRYVAGSWIDNWRMCQGNLFKTKEKAKEYREYLRALSVVKASTGWFKPSWSKERWIEKWKVIFDHRYSKFLAVSTSAIEDAGQIYFRTRDDAVESTKEHKKEWETIFKYLKNNNE